MKHLAAVLFLTAVAAPAYAHDSWIEPGAYQVKAGEQAPLTLMVGHMGEQKPASLAARPAWLRTFTSRGPRGSVDLLEQNAGRDAALATFTAPGTHLVTVRTDDFSHEMTSDEFAKYVKEEGLTAAEAAWERSAEPRGPIKEVYARIAKSLVRVGPTKKRTKAYVTTPVGGDLEIVPLRSPYDLRAGETLPVRVLYDGKPLPGALVTLGSLDRPTEPNLPLRTDAKGEAGFSMPASGKWLLNVVWSVPSPEPAEADYKTTFSSLSFGL